MTSADIIIVGSGAAGTFAAFQLRGKGVLVLDVGLEAQTSALDGNLYDLKENPPTAGLDLHAELIGARFESLHNIVNPYLSPKLKAPRMRFITENAAKLSPMRSNNFDAVMSFAAGGLANAWGAGLYRYNEHDLAGFPIAPRDLERYYDAITEKVGICGANDDLTRFFGSTKGLQAPLKIDANGAKFLDRYERRREKLNREGFFAGRPRLAVLTQAHDGRAPYRYDALEFFRPNDPAVYTPAFTLKEMVGRGDIAYQAGLLVERFAEERDGTIVVSARACAGGDTCTFRARRLILAAGALNTAKIVLRSNEDHQTRLPLLDNNVSYLPLVDPLRIGAGLEREFFAAAMLNAVYAASDFPSNIQMTLYGVAGTLRSDFLFDFPLSLRGNLAAAKYLTPAMLVVQLFYPDRPAPTNYLRLNPQGELELNYASKKMGEIERRLVKMFRRLGYWSAPSLCRYLRPGNSFHYAGALPMKAVPTGRYETDGNGRLAGTAGVYIADAANFCALPSKNHSFTMMANAMRIAAQAERSLA
jgi:choline dehydrogenase-like flavoprotein